MLVVKIIGGSLLALSMLALFLAPLAAPAAATATTTYYISSTGSDTAAGTSPSTAWRSLNRTTRGPALAPGDSILLERGSTWYDESLRISFLVGGTVGAYGNASVGRPRITHSRSAATTIGAAQSRA